MKAKNIHRLIVVGSGGIGGILADGLARTLEYKFPGSTLLLIDGDAYEEKNKERQSFGEYGHKAVVKATEIQKQLPGTYVIGIPHWIVEHVHPDYKFDKGEPGGFIPASELLEDGDIVFAVVDNFSARKVLFDAAKKLDNVSVFTGGNDDKLYGSTYHYQKINGEEVTEHPTEWHPELVNPPDRNPAELSCEEKMKLDGGTQLLAINMAIAAVLLSRFYDTVVVGNLEKNGEIHFDLSAVAMQGYDRRPEDVLVAEKKQLEAAEAALV